MKSRLLVANLNLEQIVTSVPDFAPRCHIGH